MKVICNECGRSVSFGEGLFLYRVPDLHRAKERRMMGKPFPEGGYLCLDCATRPRLTHLSTAPPGLPRVSTGVSDSPG